jgi:hypothetical protein
MIKNNELVKPQEEAVVACFDIFTNILPEGQSKTTNHEHPVQIRISNFVMRRMNVFT